MDSSFEVGKVFVGGIGIRTTEEKLEDHFRQFGEVADAMIVRDKFTSKSRGFGSVRFYDPSVVDFVIQKTHTIDSHKVEVKRFMSREKRWDMIGRSTSECFETKKIFVRGLASTSTKDDLIKYFAKYGAVSDAVIMHDLDTGQPRGFGYIIFETEDAVDKAVQNVYHNLNEKRVEVKRARAKGVARTSGSNRAMPNSQNANNNTYGRAGGRYADGGAAANTERHSGGDGYMRRS